MPLTQYSAQGRQPTRIGPMRETLVLQSNSEQTSSGTGYRTANWATYATVPGEYLQPSTGGEAFQAASVVATLPPSFRIRYRTDVRPKHRLQWNGLTLEIAAVIPVASIGNRWLILQCGQAQ